MILFDTEILKAMDDGSIVIEPFNLDHLGANSYDICLGQTLLRYMINSPTQDRFVSNNLDMKFETPSYKEEISEEGMVLMPGELYIGHTVETVGTKEKYIPHIEGRSSVGRLGMAVHITAGFGDCGFIGEWTLEITVVHPLRVYAGERIAQAYFIEGKGEPSRKYRGKYTRSTGPIASRMHLDKRDG